MFNILIFVLIRKNISQLSYEQLIKENIKTDPMSISSIVLTYHDQVTYSKLAKLMNINVYYNIPCTNSPQRSVNKHFIFSPGLPVMVTLIWIITMLHLYYRLCPLIKAVEAAVSFFQKQAFRKHIIGERFQNLLQFFFPKLRHDRYHLGNVCAREDSHKYPQQLPKVFYEM